MPPVSEDDLLIFIFPPFYTHPVLRVGFLFTYKVKVNKIYKNF